MIKLVREMGAPHGVRIGFKRLGTFIQWTRGEDGQRIVFAVIWLQRGNRLRYWYPSVTF
jgi:hypothetical protein